MAARRSALIIEENFHVPADVRVWSEATTLRDAGWQVSAICPAPKNIDAGLAMFETLDGIDIHRFPQTYAEHGALSYLREYLIAFLWIARLSWRVWRNKRFDVIQFCNPPDIFFPIACFYRLLGCRVIFDHHDLFPEMIAIRFSGIGGRLLYATARAAEFCTFRCASVVISTNQSYRQIAMQRGRAAAARVVVVRNGPKAHEFVPVAPDARLKRGFRYMACYVGNMSYEDGLLELVDAIHHIACELGRRDILFVLIGSGAVAGQTLEKARSLGLGDIIAMPGRISDNRLLRQYMSTADVLLSPEQANPLNNRSTFIKVGEYMAMGKPIVAYDLDETRWTAQEAAVYVSSGSPRAFGQAILDVLADAPRAARMGEIGRQRVLDHLAWEHQQRHLLRAYGLALGEPAGPEADAPPEAPSQQVTGPPIPTENQARSRTHGSGRVCKTHADKGGQ